MNNCTTYYATFDTLQLEKIYNDTNIYFLHSSIWIFKSLSRVRNMYASLFVQEFVEFITA